MNSPPNDSGADDFLIDDAAIDRLDAAFDNFRDDVLFKSGMDELRTILSKEEFHALEQFLVYPIYDLVDCDGQKTPIKHFRGSVENTVKVAAYLHRAAKEIGNRHADLKRQITSANRTIYICLGVISTLFAVLLYFISR